MAMKVCRLMDVTQTMNIQLLLTVKIAMTMMQQFTLGQLALGGIDNDCNTVVEDDEVLAVYGCMEEEHATSILKLILLTNLANTVLRMY